MAVTFSGSNYLTTVGSVPAYDNVSFAFWINYASVTNAPILGISNTYELTILTGTLRNQLHATTQGLATVSTFTAGVWTHIVATCNRVGNATAIYWNGVLDASGATVNTTATAGTLAIGTRGTGAGANATMEDVRMYNRVLSVAEIETIYACRGSDNIWNGLVGYWPLNEQASGVTLAIVGQVKDLTESGFNASPTGSPVYADSYLTRGA